MYIPHGECQENISVRMYITHSQSKEYVSILMYNPHSQSRENVSFVCISHIVNPRNTFPFLCTSHTVNPGKTFPFVRTSHTVLCVGSCVKGVTITHALPWLIVCFYQLHHTQFDEENCVALGYPSQELLLLEPFAKFHDTFSRFISLQLIIPVLRKFTFHIEQLFANFIPGT